jgi:hypothetical protein
VRGDDRDDSDVDFLVDVEPGRTLLDVTPRVALEQDLEQLLGRRVDVLTEGGLSPFTRVSTTDSSLDCRSSTGRIAGGVTRDWAGCSTSMNRRRDRQVGRNLEHYGIRSPGAA